MDGNPLEDISVLGAQTEWFKASPPEPIEMLRIIMKDRKIYKKTLCLDCLLPLDLIRYNFAIRLNDLVKEYFDG